jgi:lipoyltransferase/lipoate-protein ligase
MKTIINECLDARYNLALEEYVLKNVKEDIIILWQSDNSVIIGKNQNTVDEINADYVKTNKINVVRRITGGGAVYHDVGNINFSYITSVDGNETITMDTFHIFTTPLIELLQSYGIPAEFHGRNDLVVNGMKFSGNAQARHKDRLLHHGTILFNSDLTKLGNILKPKSDKFKSKGVKSVESRVTNLLPYFKEGQVLTINEFKNDLLRKFLQIDNIESITPFIYNLSENDKQKLDDLFKNKYSSYSWNYGEVQEPEFNFIRYCRYEGVGGITFQLKIIDGKIIMVKIIGDFLGYKDIVKIEEALKNTNFERIEVKEKLKRFNLKNYIRNITLDNILDCLFDNKKNNTKSFGVITQSLKTTTAVEREREFDIILMKNISEKMVKDSNGVSYGTYSESLNSVKIITVRGLDYWIRRDNNNINSPDIISVGFSNSLFNTIMENLTYIKIEPKEITLLDENKIVGTCETSKNIFEFVSPIEGFLLLINSNIVNINLNESTESTLNKDNITNENKWIFKIFIKGLNFTGVNFTGLNLSGRDFTGANFTDANLSGANLSGANFSGVNFSGANFSGANFSGANFSGVNFSGANFSGANFSGANLSGANLSGANLTDVNLSGANFSGANLTDVNFSGANLTGANLMGTDLTGANLMGTDLSGNDLRGVDLTNANLKGANLTSANLTGANIGTILTSAILTSANFTSANLTGVDLSGKNFTDANLTYTDLSSKDLRDTILKGANLTSAKFIFANLSGANLTGANLTSAKFIFANLSGANLTGANLTGTDLSRKNLTNLTGTILKGANFTSANLTGVNLSDKDLTSANFTSANLRSANLRSANLTGANLTGANLTGANLRSANLIGTNLSGANLFRAILVGAKIRRTDLEGAINANTWGIIYV